MRANRFLDCAGFVGIVREQHARHRETFSPQLDRFEGITNGRGATDRTSVDPELRHDVGHVGEEDTDVFLRGGIVTSKGRESRVSSSRASAQESDSRETVLDID